MGGNEDILAQFERFEHNSRLRVERLEAMQAQIDELMTIPEPVAVKATLDADGKITKLSIDGDRARSMSIEELERDINLALVDAARHRPQVDPEQVRAEAEYQGINAAELLESLFSGERRAFDTTPSPQWNAARTVAVVLQGSAILNVECDHSWMRRSSPDTIAAEIVRAVDQAIDGVSATGEGGPHDG